MNTTKIERVIAKGKSLAVIKQILAEEFAKDHKAQWYSDKQAEYDLLFPSQRDMTDEEKLAYDEENFTEEEPKEEEFEYPQVTIDYSEDETYLSYNDWINETRVITEAVEATYDEEDMLLTQAIPEVTELVRPYVGLADEVIETKATEYLNGKYAELRANAYPPIEEQLDMQYKDMLDGGTRFKDAILGIKNKYPKPEKG